MMKALLFCTLLLLADHVAQAAAPLRGTAAPVSTRASIGDCYNGLHNAVPPPSRGMVDLNGFGYAVCTVSVSNATIFAEMCGEVLTVNGNNNNIFSCTLQGYGHGHGRYRINGNYNYFALPHIQSGAIDVQGSGNRLLFAAWSSTHDANSGNIYYYQTADPYAAYALWNVDPGGVRDKIFRDKVNIYNALIASGCRPGTGCESRVLSYSNSGREGEHIVKAPLLPPRQQLIIDFFDCDPTANITLAAFLAHTAIETPPPAFPAVPAREPIGPYPSPHLLTPNSLEIVWLGEYNVNPAAGPPRGMNLVTAPAIFDAWSYATNYANGYPTLQMCLGSGRWTNNRSCIAKTGNQEQPNGILEWIVSQNIRAGGTYRDTITLTLTNPSGGSAVVRKPISYTAGVCP